jgi:hypothetical protein
VGFLPVGEGFFDVLAGKDGETAAADVSHAGEGLLGFGPQPDGDAVLKDYGAFASRDCHIKFTRATPVFMYWRGGLATKIYQPGGLAADLSVIANADAGMARKEKGDIGGYSQLGTRCGRRELSGGVLR